MPLGGPCPPGCEAGYIGEQRCPSCNIYIPKEIEEWADAYAFERDMAHVARTSNPGIFDAMREADAELMSLYEWLLWRGLGPLSKRQQQEIDNQLSTERKLRLSPDLDPEEELVFPSGHMRRYVDGQEVAE